MVTGTNLSHGHFTTFNVTINCFTAQWSFVNEFKLYLLANHCVITEINSVVK